MAGRQDEAVPIGPKRVGGVKTELLLPQAVSYRGHAHRRARMAGLRLLNRIDRQSADRVDAEMVKLAAAHVSSGCRVKSVDSSLIAEPHRRRSELGRPKP